jgi:CRP-like cAMP-binding protein
LPTTAAHPRRFHATTADEAHGRFEAGPGARLGRGETQRLCLLDVLPGIAEAVDPDARDVLRRALVRRTFRADEGPWDPEGPTRSAGAFAIVVLDGVLLRDSRLGGRHHTEVFGPGDVVTPWIDPMSLVPLQTAWRALSTATLAVLDEVFLTASRRWPAMSAVLAERHGETCARLGVHMSICQLPRVADRITYMLWHTAERFGRVTPDGVVVPLRLTHEELGYLIGARRSTVTLAIGALVDSGTLERRRDGSFILHGEPPSGQEIPAWPPRHMEARAPRRDARPLGPGDLGEPSPRTERAAPDEDVDSADPVHAEPGGSREGRERGRRQARRAAAVH